MMIAPAVKSALSAFNVFDVLGTVVDKIPKDQQSAVFKSAVLDIFSAKDEAMFEGLLADLAKLPDGEEAKDEILNWLARYPIVGHKFRKYVTSHENETARLDIMIAYANEHSHEHRCRRLSIVSIPPEFLRKLKLKLGELGMYLSDDDWKNIKDQKFESFLNTRESFIIEMNNSLEERKKELEDRPLWKKILW